MKILAEISDHSLNLGDSGEKLGDYYRLRKSARAILLNEKGEMAAQYARVFGYHELPGGGVERGESIEQALQREVLEEVGCDCELVKPIGMVIEYRYQDMAIYISYCYEAKIVGRIGDVKLEQAEIAEGQEIKWILPNRLLHQMKSDKPDSYRGHFILKRELTFLEEYVRLSRD